MQTFQLYIIFIVLINTTPPRQGEVQGCIDQTNNNSRTELMLTKPLRMFATSTVAQELQKTLPKLMASLLEAFRDDTMDMYVVENKEDSSQIRAAGYRNFNGKLDETTILKKCDYQVPKTLWFKVDDYGESYIGTILFPEEY